MDKNVHSKLIAEAGKKILKPLGLIQKGRSRFWRDDRNWFVIGVEFQPSSWSRGSYLNVGCSWLWQVKNYFSYDVGGRIDSFAPFDNSRQFSVAAEDLACLAAEEIRNYRSVFPDVRSVCDYYIQRNVEDIWANLHAGIACALVKEKGKADQFFNNVLESRDGAQWEEAVRLDAAQLRLLSKDHEAFQSCIIERVKRTRALQKLPEVLELSV